MHLPATKTDKSPLRRQAAPLAALRLLGALVLLAVAACSDAGPGPLQQAIDLADQRRTDAASWQPLLEHFRADVRAFAARAAGQVRSRELTPLLLEALEAESSDAALLEQVFALGQLGDPLALPALLAASGSSSEPLRAVAAEALGKIGGRRASARLMELLDPAAPRVAGEACEALTRLHGRRNDGAPALGEEQAARLLGALRRLRLSEDPDLRWRAVYALSEIPLPGRLDDLLAASLAEDADSRMFVARALDREFGSGASAPAKVRARLSQLLDDPAPFVAAAAARALSADGSRETGERLAEVLSRRRASIDFHLRAAIAGCAALAPHELKRLLDDPSPTVRRAALVAAAGVRELGTPVVAGAVGSADRFDRAAAAAAAARLEQRQGLHLLLELAQDRDPLVASSALGALADEKFRGARVRVRQALLAALAREDLAVRATALSILAIFGEKADLPEVARLFGEADGPEWIEVRQEALRAASALDPRRESGVWAAATADPSQAVRGLAEELLRREDSAETVEGGERAAADGDGTGANRGSEERRARRAGGPGAPDADHRPSSVVVREGEDFHSDAANPRALLRTTRGEVVIELLREQAPHHVRAFIDRAAAGGYDGLPFHRVVSGFVIQGLDPRGDGWGTGGVFLRDEINPVPYLRGTVGMPNSGPDTAGCQIFITHVPTPHLDGRYTVFGRVLSGMEVVDSIEVGDVCEAVEIH